MGPKNLSRQVDLFLRIEMKLIDWVGSQNATFLTPLPPFSINIFIFSRKGSKKFVSANWSHFTNLNEMNRLGRVSKWKIFDAISINFQALSLPLLWKWILLRSDIRFHVFFVLSFFLFFRIQIDSTRSKNPTPLTVRHRTETDRCNDGDPAALEKEKELHASTREGGRHK